MTGLKQSYLLYESLLSSFQEYILIIFSNLICGRAVSEDVTLCGFPLAVVVISSWWLGDCMKSDVLGIAGTGHTLGRCISLRKWRAGVRNLCLLYMLPRSLCCVTLTPSSHHCKSWRPKGSTVFLLKDCRTALKKQTLKLMFPCFCLWYYQRSQSLYTSVLWRKAWAVYLTSST